MQSRIRDVRKAKGLTLADVAERCKPATTAQTIGRLETGTRVLSLIWINRIADALGVDLSDLVALPDQQYLPVAAVLHDDGTHAPTKEERIMVPNIGGSMVGMRIAASTGEYRRGDELWMEQLQPDAYASALNLDVLVPRPGGQVHFRSAARPRQWQAAYLAAGSRRTAAGGGGPRMDCQSRSAGAGSIGNCIAYPDPIHAVSRRQPSQFRDFCRASDPCFIGGSRFRRYRHQSHRSCALAAEHDGRAIGASYVRN